MRSETVINRLFITHTSAKFGANRSMLTLLKASAATMNCGLIGPPGVSELLKCESLEVPVLEIDLPWIYAQPWEHGPKWQVRRFLQCMTTGPRLKAWANQFKVNCICSNSCVIDWGDYLARHCGSHHIWHFREFADIDYGLHPLLSKKRMKAMVTRSDAIICVSHAVAKHHDVASLPQTSVLYNGIDTDEERIIPDTARFDCKKNFRIGMAGIISEAKGFDLGIQAIQCLRSFNVPAELHIFGDGPTYVIHDLKQLCEQLSVDTFVKWHGYVDTPKDIFLDLDAFVVASRNEAFGRTTVEAMAHGVPVVGRATAGTAELIADGVNGLLFEKLEGLTLGLRRLYENDLLRSSLIDGGRKAADEKFSIAAYCRGFERIVASVCKS